MRRGTVAVLGEGISRPAKKRLIGAVLWLGWALLVYAGLVNVNWLAAAYPAVSLRYDTPISHAAATQARKQAAEQGEAAAFWPTFWAEQEGVETQGLHKAFARCLWFSGEAALVWPADFARGGAPGPLDEAGCCVSSALAWQLWGGEDVLGSAMAIGERSYTVRGVFREDDWLVMAGVGEAAFAGGWQAVELAGRPDGEARAAALGFARASGLGEPSTLVDGPGMASLAGFLAALPVAVMGLVLLVMLLRRLAKALPGSGKAWPLAFAALLLFALALPALLEALPPTFIPTRFSDFGFWARLAQAQWEYAKEWLLLRPRHIDLRAKLLLAAQAGLFAAQSIICAGLGAQLIQVIKSTRKVNDTAS